MILHICIYLTKNYYLILSNVFHRVHLRQIKVLMEIGAVGPRPSLGHPWP